jgi:hypothetical protein
MEPAAFRVASKEIRTLHAIKQLIEDEQGAELVHALGRSARSLYQVQLVSREHALPF